MGRASLNRTYKQLLEIKRIAAIDYYYKNRDKVNTKRKKKYAALKGTSNLGAG